MPASLTIDGLSDLESSVLGFVVRHHGQWDDEILKRFLHFAKVKHGAADQRELHALIRRFKALVLDKQAKLYLCTGNACTHNRRFDASAQALETAAQQQGLPVIPLKCYGSCKQAPIATLSAGGECQTFAQFQSPEDWQAVLQCAGLASKTGTCPDEASDPAAPFRFDILNDDEKPSVALQKLAFLIGDYRGEGTYGSYPTRVTKEMNAAWEAGGRYLAMRWTAQYHNPNNRKYTQRALFMLGLDEHNGGMQAWGFTNGGKREQYAVILEKGRMILEDQEPQRFQARSVRRVFTWNANPDGGYEDTMELDYGKGYSVSTRVRMQRADACPK